MEQNIFLHLKHLQQINRRPRSIECRRHALGRLEKFAATKNVGLLGLTHKQLEEFLDRPLGPQARATEISHLKSFYKWCIDEELIEVNPAFRLQRPRVPRMFPRPMMEYDKQRALQLAQGPVRTCLYLAAYAGLRACEICQIRGEDILWDEEVLVIREQKGGNPGVVALHPLLLEELKRAYKPGWLFEKGGERYAAYHEGHMTPNQLQRITNRYLKDIGVSSTLHTLRHWFGTEIYRSSRNIRLTQEAMRHGSVVTTALYTQIDKREIAGVIASLPTQNGDKIA